MTMSKAIKPVTLATELFAIEAEMKSLEEQYKQQVKPLEERKDALRKSLLANLREQGVKSLKLDNGTVYVRAFKTTLKVHDDHEAMEWAAANNSLKVDTTKAW